MIFDEDLLPPAPPKCSHTSLENILQERKNRAETLDFSDFYRPFRLEINREFFGPENARLLNEERVLTRRQRRIQKMPVITHFPQKKEQKHVFLKSMSENSLSCNRLPVLEQKRNFVCSVRELENVLPNLPSFHGKFLDLSKKKQPDMRCETLKSLESLEQKEKVEEHLNEKKCRVCLKKFRLKAILAITNRCEHVFHEVCLKRKLRESEIKTEPLCPECHNLL